MNTDKMIHDGVELRRRYLYRTGRRGPSSDHNQQVCVLMREDGEHCVVRFQDAVEIKVRTADLNECGGFASW